MTPWRVLHGWEPPAQFVPEPVYLLVEQRELLGHVLDRLPQLPVPPRVLFRFSFKARNPFLPRALCSSPPPHPASTQHAADRGIMLA